MSSSIEKIVIVTGGFDPIHAGHINYIKAASELGCKLIVGLNSDDWLERKKGKPFMPFEERKTILEAIKYVDEVRAFNDIDDSAADCIQQVLNEPGNMPIVFANGGDRNILNTPEKAIRDSRLEFVFNVGGDKTNSSTRILSNWNNEPVVRDWGHYIVLTETDTLKVKKLVINPGKSTSIQKHANRGELWYVAEGCCEVTFNDRKCLIKAGETHYVDREVKHQLTNTYTEPCCIIESQLGKDCDENDIERINE